MFISITNNLISHLQNQSSYSNPLNLIHSQTHTSQNKTTIIIQIKLLQTFPTHSKTNNTTISLKNIIQQYPKIPNQQYNNTNNKKNQKKNTHF